MRNKVTNMETRDSKDLVCAVVTRDLFTQNEDLLVANHLLLHRGIESITNGHLWERKSRPRNKICQAHRVFVVGRRISAH